MRLAWTLPWCLFKRNNCETPHWEQDFRRSSVPEPSCPGPSREEGKSPEGQLQEKGHENSTQKEDARFLQTQDYLISFGGGWIVDNSTMETEPANSGL